MKIGDMVRFKVTPTKNTPGGRYCMHEKQLPIGIVTKEITISGRDWFEVMWPGGCCQCYGRDLESISGVIE